MVGGSLSLTSPPNAALRQRRYSGGLSNAHAFRVTMSMPVEQPQPRRPSLMVYGLLIVIACCLPALLLAGL